MSWPKHVDPPRHDIAIERAIREAFAFVAGDVKTEIIRSFEDGHYHWRTESPWRNNALSKSIEVYFDGSTYHAVAEGGPKYQPGMHSHGAFTAAIAGAVRAVYRPRPTPRVFVKGSDDWCFVPESERAQFKAARKRDQRKGA